MGFEEIIRKICVYIYIYISMQCLNILVDGLEKMIFSLRNSGFRWKLKGVQI